MKAIFIGGPADGKHWDVDFAHPELVMCTQLNGANIIDMEKPMLPHRYTILNGDTSILMYYHHSFTRHQALEAILSRMAHTGETIK